MNFVQTRASWELASHVQIADGMLELPSWEQNRRTWMQQICLYWCGKHEKKPLKLACHRNQCCAHKLQTKRTMGTSYKLTRHVYRDRKSRRSRDSCQTFRDRYPTGIEGWATFRNFYVTDIQPNNGTGNLSRACFRTGFLQ